MNAVSENVQTFFENYEKGISLSDSDLLGKLYAETFMFAGQQGSQAVKRDDFLKVVPKRSAFFKTIGLVSSTIRALEETRLDDDYLLIKVYWIMRFEKDAQPPVFDENSATYILFEHEHALQIVFQLDHQDLTKRVQELGLLPAS